MTHQEFASWLDGFLTGKLSPEDHKTVMDKAHQAAPMLDVVPPSPWPPMDTTYWPPRFTPDVPPWPYPIVTCGNTWGHEAK